MESQNGKPKGAPTSLTPSRCTRPKFATRPKFEPLTDEKLGQISAADLLVEYRKLREFMARLIPTDQRAMDFMIKARSLQLAHEEGWTEQQGYMACITGWFPRGMYQGDLTL